MNAEKKFSLRGHLPKIVQLNRPFVLGLSAFLLFVLILAIVSAFDQPVAKKTPAHEVTISQATMSTPPIVSDVVQKLPSDYQDIDKIKKFQSESANQNIAPEVMQELDTLKQQQVELEQRLSIFKIAADKAQSHSGEQQQQAQSSNLFFPGTMPMPEDYLKKSGPDDASKKTTTTTTSGYQPPNPYDRQNMQDQKVSFLKTTDDDSEDIYDLHGMVDPISPYEVQGGALIPAVLITAINTSLPGDVVAQVRQDIYDSVSGKFLLIPKGSKLLGEYDSKISYGQRRVLLVFTRIIRPDGSSVLLTKSGGTDLKGAAGMEGDVNNHWMSVLSAATLSTILSVGAGVGADHYATGTNITSAQQAGLLGASNSISQVGQNIADRAMNVQPTLTIPQGFEFNVIVKKDMVLKPYQLPGKDAPVRLFNNG